MNNPYIIVISLLAFIIQGCNKCDCEEGDDLQGYYVCTRESDNYKEKLWLTRDKYIHILEYDTIQFINSDEWMIRKNGSDLFIANNWVSPCKYGYSYCYQYMDYVDQYNFAEYKGSEAQLIAGCFSGLDEECRFRLRAAFEPMYNYKRISDKFIIDINKSKSSVFYTQSDSLNFYDLIERSQLTIK